MASFLADLGAHLVTDAFTSDAWRFCLRTLDRDALDDFVAALVIHGQYQSIHVCRHLFWCC
jgi:hypothetical protein